MNIKKIIFFVLLLISSKLLTANPYTPGSQAWHDWNGMAATEAEKMRQRQNNSYTPPRIKEPVYNTWSAFVYNDETGDYYYSGTHTTTGSQKAIVDAAKKQLLKDGIKANKVVYWKDVYILILMGKNKKTGKWETIHDTDMRKWKKYIDRGLEGKEILDALEDDFLEKCRQKLDNCQVVLNWEKIMLISKQNKKGFK